MTRQCDCWKTYSYPDRVVLAIVDERQRLANRNDSCYNQIRKMRVVARMQGERIREMDSELMVEQEMTNTQREQLQATNNRLEGMVRQVRYRTEGILAECEVLMEKVVGENLNAEGQGLEAPGVGNAVEPIEKDPKEDPEEEEPREVEPEEEIGSSGTVQNQIHEV